VASDAPILASQMDGTILVVETGETRKAAAKHSVVMLQKARANILGIMYNKMTALDGPGYYYYQYQYKTPALEDKASSNGSKALPISGETREE
jgi:Mrp family chromosome partitioning ATPase